MKPPDKILRQSRYRIINGKAQDNNRKTALVPTDEGGFMVEWENQEISPSFQPSASAL